MVLALWTWLFPELSLIDNKADRLAALGKAQAGIPIGRLVILFLIPSIIAGYTWDFSRPNVLLVLVMVFPAAIAPPMAIWVSRRSTRRRLWKTMREYGVVLCLKCGFDLRGQTSPRCPECGTEFDEYYLCAPSERTDTKDS